MQAAQRQLDEARGALTQLKARLKEEFACSDVAKAKKKLAQLRDTERELSAEYGKAKAKFEAKYADQLNPTGSPKKNKDDWTDD